MESSINSKKILLVATEFGPGMSAFATTIAKTLMEDSSLDVSFLTVTKKEDSGNIVFTNQGNKVYCIKYPKHKIVRFFYKFYPIKIIKELNRLMLINEYDVIHFLTGDFALFPWLFLTNKWGGNFYYNVHDLHRHEYNFSFLKKHMINYMFWGNSHMYKYIKNLNTSSLTQYDELKKLYPQKNIFFTHAPSVITESVMNGKMKVKELIGMNNYILFFGSVDLYKGVDILIDAYKKSKIQNKYKLVIAGKGIDFENLSENIIRINRFIHDSEVRSLYENASFTVYPYRSATQSAITALSFYFRKKAILSDIPFFIENKTEDTVFFKCGDSDDLKEKLDNMIVKDASFASYEKLYSPKVLLNDYKKMYCL